MKIKNLPIGVLYKTKHEFGIFKTNIANRKEIKIHEINE
jgi:hypothetical protein